MADSSFEWARKRGLTRMNEVHKMEEAKLVLEDFFEGNLEKGHKVSFKGEQEIEDSPWVHCIIYPIKAFPSKLLKFTVYG